MSMDLIDKYRYQIGNLFITLDFILSKLKAGKYHLIPYLMIFLSTSCVFCTPFLLIKIVELVLFCICKKEKDILLENNCHSHWKDNESVKLRIATFNIRCGIDCNSNYNLSRTASSIKTLNAHIVLIQEVTTGAQNGWIGSTI